MSARTTRIGLVVHRDQIQRIVPLLETREGAGFQNHAGMTVLVGNPLTWE